MQTRTALLALCFSLGAVQAQCAMMSMPGMAMSDAAAGTQASVKIGALEISGGAVKAMLPGAKVGGGGLSIRNGGPQDDVLVSVKSPAAGRVELHEMVMQGDVMKMRKLDHGIPIPAGQTVDLTTGGLHLMFMDVKTPFAEGGSVPITLIFQNAGRVDYILPIGNAAGMTSQSQ